MKFKIGTFYSQNTPYEGIYKKYLLSSCKKLNLDVQVIASSNYGNWYRNVAEKPRVISEMLDLFINNDEILLFLDSDSIIEQYPSLIEEIPKEYDIGYHTLEWNSWYSRNDNPSIKELLTGTMIFRNRQKVRNLCKEWYEKSCKELIWEQKVLNKIINNYDLKKYKLPLNYCYINSLPGNKEPVVKCDNVVIRHFQASREFKRKKL